MDENQQPTQGASAKTGEKAESGAPASQGVGHEAAFFRCDLASATANPRRRKGSRRAHQPTRRHLSPLDSVGIAGFGAAVVVAISWLPTLWAYLSTDFGVFSPWSARSTPAADGPVQALALFIGLLTFQKALQNVERRRMKLTRPLLGVVGCLTAAICLGRAALWFGFEPALLPLGLAGLWVAASYGPAVGLLSGLFTLGGIWLVTPLGAEVFLLALRAALPALLLSARRPMLTGFGAAAASGFAAAAACLFASRHGGLEGVDPVLLAGFLVIGGLFEGALHVVSRGVGERLLGHVSRERLHDLLDLEQPLLKRMVTRAPGSFEHSRAMANLAEQAASAIGADALLTRVGAYYHDLGKSIEPKYFVENLDHGERNPHDELSPKESTRQIIRHVVEGVGILREAGIPEPVVEFAYTHHGTQRVEYFLNKERKLCEVSGEPVEETAFCYPGMKPKTKETAILMLIDSIEAASRTVQIPERRYFEEMVRRVVFTKLGSGQLDESGLSMHELRVACARVVETLVHMHHHRIEYPWQKERARQFGVEERELAESAQPRRRREPVERSQMAEKPRPSSSSRHDISGRKTA